MGSGPATNAVLAYGFDVGGSDKGFTVREADKFGQIKLDWFDSSAGHDFQELGMQHLAAAGLVYQPWFQGEQPVCIVKHCSRPFPAHIIAAGATVVVARRGQLQHLNMAQLVGAVDQRVDVMLSEACQALGITPFQPHPGWFLVSYWDLES
jgi:energy-converting hydrogenase Eha subunit A